jgi:hypothetical protein
MQTYSKCHNLKIDGGEYTTGLLGLDWFPSTGASARKQRYEMDIVKTLDRLAGSWTGWAVINEIFFRQWQMTIHPYFADPVNGQFNAYAQPTDAAGPGSQTSWAAATLKETTMLDPHGNMPAAGKPRITGTGAGSNVEIRFSADTFAAHGAPTGAGSAPDEILLHEMIHGLRQMQGRAVFEAITGNPGMDNYEEFAAITISNVYRSEKGFVQLRADHHGFAPLTGPTANLATFKSTYRSWLSHMDVEQPRLCQNLRQIKCAFNPFIF